MNEQGKEDMALGCLCQGWGHKAHLGPLPSRAKTPMLPGMGSFKTPHISRSYLLTGGMGSRLGRGVSMCPWYRLSSLPGEKWR